MLATLATGYLPGGEGEVQGPAVEPVALVAYRPVAEGISKCYPSRATFEEVRC